MGIFRRGGEQPGDGGEVDKGEQAENIDVVKLIFSTDEVQHDLKQGLRKVDEGSVVITSEMFVSFANALLPIIKSKIESNPKIMKRIKGVEFQSIQKERIIVHGDLIKITGDAKASLKPLGSANADFNLVLNVADGGLKLSSVQVIIKGKVASKFQSQVDEGISATKESFQDFIPDFTDLSTQMTESLEMPVERTGLSVRHGQFLFNVWGSDSEASPTPSIAENDRLPDVDPPNVDLSDESPLSPLDVDTKAPKLDVDLDRVIASGTNEINALAEGLTDTPDDSENSPAQRGSRTTVTGTERIVPKDKTPKIDSEGWEVLSEALDLHSLNPGDEIKIRHSIGDHGTTYSSTYRVGNIEESSIGDPEINVDELKEKMNLRDRSTSISSAPKKIIFRGTTSERGSDRHLGHNGRLLLKGLYSNEVLDGITEVRIKRAQPPKTGVDLPDVDIKAPKVDVDLPDVDIKAPSAPTPETALGELVYTFTLDESVDYQKADTTRKMKFKYLDSKDAVQVGARKIDVQFTYSLYDEKFYLTVGRSGATFRDNSHIAVLSSAVQENSSHTLELDAINKVIFSATFTDVKRKKTGELVGFKIEMRDKTPNDFSKIDGISLLHANFLKMNGVNTFEELAAMTVDELKSIGKSEVFRERTDLASWISQAKELAGGEIDAPAPPEEVVGGEWRSIRYLNLLSLRPGDRFKIYATGGTFLLQVYQPETNQPDGVYVFGEGLGNTIKGKINGQEGDEPSDLLSVEKDAWVKLDEPQGNRKWHQFTNITKIETNTDNSAIDLPRVENTAPKTPPAEPASAETSVETPAPAPEPETKFTQEIIEFKPDGIMIYNSSEPNIVGYYKDCDFAVKGSGEEASFAVQESDSKTSFELLLDVPVGSARPEIPPQTIPKIRIEDGIEVRMRSKGEQPVTVTAVFSDVVKDDSGELETFTLTVSGVQKVKSQAEAPAPVPAPTPEPAGALEDVDVPVASPEAGSKQELLRSRTKELQAFFLRLGKERKKEDIERSYEMLTDHIDLLILSLADITDEKLLEANYKLLSLAVVVLTKIEECMKLVFNSTDTSVVKSINSPSDLEGMSAFIQGAELGNYGYDVLKALRNKYMMFLQYEFLKIKGNPDLQEHISNIRSIILNQIITGYEELS
jgi:hypothetical protein